MTERCAAALRAIDRAMAMLPARMESREAVVMLLAIGLQESRLTYRRQIGGPARGLWQFECGTRESRGGVFGVFLHPASGVLLRRLCVTMGVEPSPASIYAAIEHDDVLAAGVARLLLWTHPEPLPAIGDRDAAWEQYIAVWRPGKPHPGTWPALYAEAVEAMEAAL